MKKYIIILLSLLLISLSSCNKKEDSGIIINYPDNENGLLDTTLNYKLSKDYVYDIKATLYEYGEVFENATIYDMGNDEDMDLSIGLLEYSDYYTIVINCNGSRYQYDMDISEKGSASVKNQLDSFNENKKKVEKGTIITLFSKMYSDGDSNSISEIDTLIDINDLNNEERNELISKYKNLLLIELEIK